MMKTQIHVSFQYFSIDLCLQWFRSVFTMHNNFGVDRFLRYFCKSEKHREIDFSIFKHLNIKSTNVKDNIFLLPGDN